MKKIVLLVVTSLVIQSTVFAGLCESSMGNLSFSGISIDDSGHARCNYSYCYYGCMTNSYELGGCYKPGEGTWQNGSCSNGCTVIMTPCVD